jgi:hypothetical protein
MSRSARRTKTEVAPERPRVTVAAAFTIIQEFRHRAVLLDALAAHLGEFLAQDVGPAGYRIVGPWGSEPPRHDVVYALQAELRLRSEHERARALQVLRALLDPAEHIVPISPEKEQSFIDSAIQARAEERRRFNEDRKDF